MSVINQRLSPEDAKAEASRINDVSDSILGHISERYQTRKDKSKPLVVLLGETHSDPSHRAVQLSVMARLYQSFDPDVVSCGMEGHLRPVTKLLQSMMSESSYPPNQLVRIKRVSEYLCRCPADDPVNLSAAANFADVPDSPKMYKALQYLLLRDGIQSFFNDVATVSGNSGSSEIDFSDGKVWAYYQNFVHKEKAPNMLERGACISAASLHGTYFRNYFMACVANTQIKKREPKLFIQLCGASHVSGYGNDFSSREALAQILEREGHNVLGITLPSVVAKDSSPENIIHYAFDGAVKFPKGQTDLEADWMEAVLPHVLLDDWSEDFMEIGEELVEDYLLRAFEP